jgi:hypothetical protein
LVLTEHLVRMERLELSRVAPLEPKSSASTNFATFAHKICPDYTPFAEEFPARSRFPSRFDPKTRPADRMQAFYYKTREYFFICSFFGRIADFAVFRFFVRPVVINMFGQGYGFKDGSETGQRRRRQVSPRLHDGSAGRFGNRRRTECLSDHPLSSRTHRAGLSSV